jgi:DNA-binding transcriptional LysR family regulator
MSAMAVPTRGSGGSITRAATQLAMSHAALSEWVARRSLPA